LVWLATIAATCTPACYTLSLHDALPISGRGRGVPLLTPRGLARRCLGRQDAGDKLHGGPSGKVAGAAGGGGPRGVQVVRERSARSEEHTSELQSRENLVCRLLLE